VDERITAYETSIANLRRANADLRAERGRLKWVAIVTLLASPAALAAFGATVGAFVLIIGGSAFFVGHYVVFMHIHENTLTIRSAKQTIASITRQCAAPDRPPANGSIALRSSSL